MARGHVGVDRVVDSKSRILMGLFRDQVVEKTDWITGPPPLPSSCSHHSLKWPSHFAVLVPAPGGTGIGVIGKEGGDPTRASLPMHAPSSLAA